MSTLHPDVRSFVLGKQPATSLDCAKFAQLSFQIKQVHNQGFMRAANTFVERPAFARPAEHFQQAARQPHFTRANRPPMGRGGSAGSNAYQQRGGPCYYQRPPTMNGRGYSPTLYARTRGNRKEMFDCDDCVSHDKNYCDEMYNESAMVDGLNSNTEYANDKFIIPVNINGIQVQAIRDTGNFGATLVSETLIPKSALDHDNAISMIGVFNEKPKGCRQHLFVFSVIDCNKTQIQKYWCVWACIPSPEV